MRYAKPAAAGLLPLAAGYVFDFAILHLPAFFPLYFIVQLALLIGWGALAYKLSKDAPATACAALMCAFLMTFEKSSGKGESKRKSPLTANRTPAVS